jgi:hypothetical protein
VSAEGVLERPGPRRSDAGYPGELIGRRIEHTAHGPEAGEERAGAHDRDARHRGERRLGDGGRVSGLRTLGVRGSSRRGAGPLASDGQTVEPSGRVVAALGPQQDDPQFGGREARAAHGIRVQRASVEPHPLDEEVGNRAGGLQRPELRPEPPLQNGCVKIEDALPLDDAASADVVVAGGEARDLDDCPEPLERSRQAAGPLATSTTIIGAAPTPDRARGVRGSAPQVI